MCFNRKWEDIYKSAKIANDNITCYKFLLRQPNGDLFSPIRGQVKWEEGKVEKSELKEEHYNEIHIGLHSFKSAQEAKYYRFRQGYYGEQYYAVFEFVIPKGAKYYENDEQYVSDTLYLKSKEPVKTEEVLVSTLA